MDYKNTPTGIINGKEEEESKYSQINENQYNDFENRNLLSEEEKKYYDDIYYAKKN